jgi:uncharacterized DUF497 family protein
MNSLMNIDGLIWDPAVLEKLERKHHVTGEEVESVFFAGHSLHMWKVGNVYHALGRSDEGRYLCIIFLYMGGGKARPISARDMVEAERRMYRGR